MMFLLHIWLAALAAFADSGRALAGNFTNTCSHFELHRGAAGFLDQLSASCLVANANGTAHSVHAAHNSTLDLNLCLGIDYSTAALVWSIYGKFSNYCKACHVVNRTTLGCACSTLSGVHNNSTINLDDGIANTNGTLSCQGGSGM